MSSDIKIAGVTKSDFGTLPDGSPVDLFTLQNFRGVSARITNYGAILTELHVPDRHGQLADVVLGFDNLKQYLDGHPYFGATIGRFGNRIANARFTLNGKNYTLAANNGPNSLHGGAKGFDKVLWKAEPFNRNGEPGVRFNYLSPDGEEGYPGNLDVAVAYTLTNENELKIEYTAATDQPTPVNLTHHSYFNLTGGQFHGILGHELYLAADQYTPVSDALIPTGELRTVRGTPLDFTQPHFVGARIEQIPGTPGGYDHNFVLTSAGRSLSLAARLFESTTGRTMEVLTTEPAIQFYSGNFLDGTLTGKRGVTYNKHHGLCLETQHYPDSVNQPSFPNTILAPGQIYTQTTLYRFSAK